MRILSRVLCIVIAAGWVPGSPVTAQIKNPIQAAKDAFKKAREAEEAKLIPPPSRPTASPRAVITRAPIVARSPASCRHR